MQRVTGRWQIIGAIVGLLAAIDIGFMVGYVIAVQRDWPIAWTWWVGLDWERCAPERYQYVKELTIAVGAFALWRVRRETAYWLVSLLFIYLLLDDALEFHERGGVWLASTLGLSGQWGLSGRDFGEIIMMAGAGTLMLVVMLAHRSATAITRRYLWLLYLLLIMFAGFGIGADVFHQLARKSEYELTGILIEEGGEMLTMTAMVGLTARWYLRHKHAESDPAPDAAI